MTQVSTILAAVPLRKRSVMVEANQDVQDIIKCLTYYHKRHIQQYDQFAYTFDVGDERAIAKKLFYFCKDNIDYVIEKKKRQTVRSPARILHEGHGDCKHYASFIAGVLDSLKRDGLDLDWAFRFAEYDNPWQDEVSNHVFVVLRTPDRKEIWIDPVLNWFDYHLPYDRAITRTVNTVIKDAGMGCPGGCRCAGQAMGCTCSSMGDAGNDLATALKAYEEGIYTAYSDFMKKGLISAGVNDILKSAVSSGVPGAAVAQQIANGLQTGITKTFGPGSTLTRITGSLLSSNVLTAIPNVLKAAFGGRTYNTDSYFGASDYYYHVLGIDKGASTNVSDAEVPPALFWFITKLGIYISGRAHLEALRNSVDSYLAFYKYNNKTTQDRVRVQLARDVMMRYMPAVNIPGNWKNTIGVYDDAVTAQIVKARLADPNAETDTQGIVPTSPLPGTTQSLTAGLNLGPMLILAGAAFYILSSNK